MLLDANMPFEILYILAYGLQKLISEKPNPKTQLKNQIQYHAFELYAKLRAQEKSIFSSQKSTLSYWQI